MKELHFKILNLIVPLFIFILYGTVLFLPQSTGYELSIYNAYPAYFFLLVVITLALSTYLSMYSIYRLNSRFFFIINVFWIFLTIFLLYLIPLGRGYGFFERDDALTHVGMIRDILITDHIGQTNYYPFFHLIIYLIIITTGIPATDENLFIVKMMIPFIFFIFYVISIYLITRLKSNDKNDGIYSYIAILLALTIFNMSFTPSGTLFLFFPFLLFTYYLDSIRNSISTKILFVIILFSIPFGHPELVLFALLVFFLYSFIGYIVSKYNLKFSGLQNGENKATNKITIKTNHILLLLTTFLVWYTTYVLFGTQVKRLANWFISEVGTAPISGMLTSLTRANLPINEFILLLVKTYGSYALYLLFALVIGYLIIKTIFNKKIVQKDYILLFLLVIFNILFSITSLFNDVLLTYGRILKYPLLFSIILIAIFLANNFNSIKKSKKIFYTIFVLLIASSTITVFNVYPSPNLYTYNQQVTNNEINGTNWLINYGNRSMETIDAYVVFGRFVSFREGYDYALQNDLQYSKQLYSSRRFPPDNFNYTNSSTLGSSYDSDRYMLLSQLVKDFYFKLFPDKARFTKDDFSKLDADDQSVDVLYENGEFNIYYIRGTKMI